MRKNNELVYSDNDFKKIQDLYEKFLKTQKIASEIPEILEKLECLKYMHENSGKTGHDLINLKNNEKVISEKLQENKILLEKVEKLFLTNLKGFFEKIRDVEEKTNVLLNK